MNLRRLPFLFLALAFGALFAASLLRAQENIDADLDAANTAYQAGRYEEAAKLFGQLIADRGYSAPLCFDLGNAEFKAGRMGPALLNYERARYLAPGDAGIEHKPAVRAAPGRARSRSLPLVAGCAPQHQLGGLGRDHRRVPALFALRHGRHRLRRRVVGRNRDFRAGAAPLFSRRLSLSACRFFFSSASWS